MAARALVVAVPEDPADADGGPPVIADGYHLTRTVAPVAESEVDRRVTELCELHATWTPVAGTPAVRDRVRARIAFRIAGSDAPYESYEDHFIIGGGRGDPAFERLIQTMRAGETRHEPALVMEANTARVLDVQVTLHTAEAMTPAALTNALVQRVARCRSVALYLARTRTAIARHHRDAADQDVRRQLFTQMAALHPDIVPDQAAVDQLVEQAVAQSVGTMTDAQRGITAQQARRHVVALAVLDRIVAVHGLAATPSDVARYAATVAKTRRVSSGRVRRDFETYGHLPRIERWLAQEKALAFVLRRNPPIEQEPGA